MLTPPSKVLSSAVIGIKVFGVKVCLMQKTIVIQSSSDLARKLCREIMEQINSADFSQDECFGIQLAIEEAMINAVEHGNKSDPLKTVTVEYSITPDTFAISITDEGCGFTPDKVPDPREDENLHNVTGRGIVLMREYMDSVEYNAKGDCVRMIKYAAHAKNKE
jgi:serine/threonine-protein kinase RsbW